MKTDKLTWPDLVSKKEWKKKMIDPNEWGDEIVLNLVSNLLEVVINVIPAFRESSCNQDKGFTIISPLNSAKHDPLFLFAFSDSDFSSAHYTSIFPKTVNFLPPPPPSFHPTAPPSFLPTAPPSFLPPDFDIEEGLQIEDIDFTDIQIIVDGDQTNQQVLIFYI